MLTVVLVAYPLAPVGPDAVGGAEQVVSMLDDALVEDGHRSIVVAQEGSVVRGELVALPRPEGRLDHALGGAQERVRRALAGILATRRPDLVHLHGVDWPAYVPESGPPVLATLHLPPELYGRGAFDRLRVHLQCVSEAQRAALGLDVRVIPNGVRLGEYRPAPRSDHVVCLGRICPEKGYDLAVDAAKRAGVGLRLAGQLFAYPVHEAWFEKDLRPRLDDQRIFLGPVAGVARRELLATARALIVPSRVAETSSLVAMEALAVGTPVIARRVGALTEVVEEGVTGLFADTVDEIALAIGRIGAIDPARCRAEAERRFDHRQMTAKYLSLYADLSRGAGVPAGPAAGLESLDDVAGDWADLWDRCPSAGAFQRPEWNLSWARHFPGDAFALAVRRGGRLVGLLPLFRHDGVLRILGTGISDHLDALVDPAHPDAWEALRGALPDEPISFDDLPADSPLLRWPGEIGEATPCPALDLPATVKPRRPRHRVEIGEDRGLEALFALHAARWEERGEAGVLADPRVREHHREVAATMPGVRSFVLRWDGAPVAAYYGFVLRDRATYYLSGFDPAFAKESPGRQVVGLAIEDATRSGARLFDFLRGQEPYKYAWGATDRPKRRLVRA